MAFNVSEENYYFSNYIMFGRMYFPQW